jgi:hypothetical protein
MTVAVDADVPEPSPLFWDHLSARIGERIDAESDRSWWQAWIRPRVLVPLSAAACCVLIVALAPVRATLAWLPVARTSRRLSSRRTTAAISRPIRCSRWCPI